MCSLLKIASMTWHGRQGEAGGFLGTTHAKTLRNLFICSHIHILLINTILMIYIYYIL